MHEKKALFTRPYIEVWATIKKDRIRNQHSTWDYALTYNSFIYIVTRDENNWLYFGWLDLFALCLQSFLLTINRALSLIYTFQFTVAHALGFSVFTSRLLATYLNTETSTSNHYEVFLPFLVQSPWNLGTQLKLSF
jgi:hypothetical protein